MVTEGPWVGFCLLTHRIQGDVHRCVWFGDIPHGLNLPRNNWLTGKSTLTGPLVLITYDIPLHV